MSALCRHFGPCGGCLLQDMPDDLYRAHKRQLVVDALRQHGLACDVADPVSVPPRSRRRATFKAAKLKGEARIGFHARQSHEIVDMRECRLLSAALFSRVAGLREMMAALLKDGETAELHLTETETAPDLAIAWKKALKPALVSSLAEWAARLKLARIIVGQDIAVALATPHVAFGKAKVALPPRAFLQPTHEGEAALQSLVMRALPKTKQIADLFCGCGTFALPLAQTMRVHAVERETASLDALAGAVRHTQGLKPVTTERRDLFKLPLSVPELARFDAVVLDPPRAGAFAQMKELAASAVKRIVYVSCNPQSFARDARVLIEAGFRMDPVTPVDQFLWSDHVELVGAFTRR